VSKKIFFSLLLAFGVLPLSAQVQTGQYSYGSFDTPGIDTIDRGSLNVHFSIPVVTKQGRGLPFQYQLVYDGLVWTPVTSAGVQTWTADSGWGLRGQLNSEGFKGYLTYFERVPKCYSGSSFTYEPIDDDYVYHDAFGVSHSFNYVANYCTDTFTGGGVASDGSGYAYNGGNVVSVDGKQISVPVNN
jgi:hypothetical protein